MTSETKTIEVTAYRDSQGDPCCAADFMTGEVCRFYRSAVFGTKELCGFNDQRLERRDSEVGTLIPHSECPVWRPPQTEKAPPQHQHQ